MLTAAFFADDFLAADLFATAFFATAFFAAAFFAPAFFAPAFFAGFPPRIEFPDPEESVAFMVPTVLPAWSAGLSAGVNAVAEDVVDTSGATVAGCLTRALDDLDALDDSDDLA